ncbi:MAG: DMT family transporter [Methylobacterium sp.]|nr:DMT family transporter [Methylobacterium sp.]MCE2931484.1 DMT family transporter [Hyphomicrobiales bacterium]MCA3654236.1 DMT family transporter [Methylobacterium sp.]MCA3656825.1 DMT family transporter [Methylobacterium sp.]MCA3662176.1 DMT family transporter [Methylobacterium sp.]
MSLVTVAPALFVLIWSTGWIVAKYAASFADPLFFLVIRFACAFVLMALIALAFRAEWPRNRAAYGHGMLSGVLLHAIYLGGVWWAVAHGLPVGVSALIAAIQPLITAALAARLGGERLGALQLSGIAIGFLGVMGVIAPKLAGLSAGTLESLAGPVLVNVIAMIAVTLGTFYQKRYIASGDLRVVSSLQYAGAFLALLPLALLLEPLRFESRWETWAALAWSVIPLSLGAISLMLMMIRRGAVSRVAALIYLIPPTAAIEAYLMFGETLTVLQIAFMALTAFGVYLATRPARPA